MKQQEVFDLLLQQQTSKEIARALKISPAAVEQRITAGRRSMGGLSRRDAILAYARELEAGTIQGNAKPCFLAKLLSKRKMEMGQNQPAIASTQRLIFWSLLTIGGTIIALQIGCLLGWHRPS